MKSTVEKLSPTRVRINVEVPFAELEPDFSKAYKELAQQVRLPGFRPGKAPAKLLEARVGRAAVLEQVVNAALPARYSEAVTASDVKPLGQPEIEVTKIEDGQELTFTAEVDVRPEIELPDLSGVAVTVKPAPSRTPRSRPSWTRCAPDSAPSRVSSAPPRTATSSRSICRPPLTARRSRRRRPPVCRTRSAPDS
ncbi:trigger factor Tig [Mycobacteroides abscessus]|nr:trigger factor Tig [Mycobacteroides abscessus]